jgi:hypothetical membrane protein
MRTWPGAGAVAGIAGPVAFTGAWVVSSLLQAGHPVTQIQISGLAAPDARDPWIMISGFVILGGGSIAFGESLHRALRSRLPPTSAPAAGSRRRRRPRRAGPGPRLIQCAGLLAIAAGLLRRDHMLLDRPAGESWHNHAHDLVSAIIYLLLAATPLLLAVRFHGDEFWRPLWFPLAAGSLVTAGFIAVFAADTSGPDAGWLQRVAVTIPLALLAAVAARLLTAPSGLPGRLDHRAAHR